MLARHVLDRPRSSIAVAAGIAVISVALAFLAWPRSGDARADALHAPIPECAAYERAAKAYASSGPPDVRHRREQSIAQRTAAFRRSLQSLETPDARRALAASCDSARVVLVQQCPSCNE